MASLGTNSAKNDGAVTEGFGTPSKRVVDMVSEAVVENESDREVSYNFLNVVTKTVFLVKVDQE